MDPAIKKQVLRMFTYGLYIVMAEDNNIVNAFTANWLTQVSFEPPLIAVSIENTAATLPLIQQSEKFTINVLRSDQRDLAGTLGKSAVKHPDKMANIHYTKVNEQYPVLPETRSWVACEVRHTVPAGDSTLVVAEVVDTGILNEGTELTMKEAGFRHAG